MWNRPLSDELSDCTLRHVGGLAEGAVHGLGAFDDDRPYLLRVDGFGDHCPDAADQAGDAYDRHIVISPRSGCPLRRSESGGFGTGTMKGPALRTWPDSPHLITPSANARSSGLTTNSSDGRHAAPGTPTARLAGWDRPHDALTVGNAAEVQSRRSSCQISRASTCPPSAPRHS